MLVAVKFYNNFRPQVNLMYCEVSYLLIWREGLLDQGWVGGTFWY